MAEPCCEHCITRLGFGPRRKRILLLLTHHPELDTEDFYGQLIADTDRGGRVRGSVHEKVLLPPIEPTTPVHGPPEALDLDYGSRRRRAG